MSGFKPRGYDREATQRKVRDYSLFVIACEGTEQEPAYFKPFDNGSNRIKVDVIEQEEGQRRSAPKHVLTRAQEYIEKVGLSEKDGDTLWLVVDVDRWPRKQHNELKEFCEANPNWNVIISNPCFEIWLLFHKKEKLDDLDCSTPEKTKKEFNKLGSNLLEYIPLMEKAIKNAKANDANTRHFMPNPKETKVYHLAEALFKRMGRPAFEKFVKEYLPTLKPKAKKKD